MKHQQNGHSSNPWNNKVNDAYSAYHHHAESEDSPSDHDEEHHDDHEHEIDFVRIQSHAKLPQPPPQESHQRNLSHHSHHSHGRHLSHHQSHRNTDLLPEIPDIPAMPQVEDVDMKPEEQLLKRHVGFVLKLNG